MGNSKSKSSTSVILTDEDIEYLLENTHFNRNEIVIWHSQFIEECPEGRINKANFKNVYKKNYAHGRADKFCEYLFRAYDVNNNGYIDFKEFLIPISINSRGTVEEKLEMAFSMFDIDKNNYIDKKEMEKLLTIIYELTGETDKTGMNDPVIKVIQVMNKLDVNHDGLVSKDEFVTGCMQDENLRKLLTPQIK